MIDVEKEIKKNDSRTSTWSGELNGLKDLVRRVAAERDRAVELAADILAENSTIEERESHKKWVISQLEGKP